MQRYDSYKDSGIQWLGEIPSHWEVLAIKHILKPKKKIVGKQSFRYDLLSLTLQGIIKRDVDNPTGKFPSSFDTYQEVNEGDFVFCNFDNEETPRAVGLSCYNGMITGAYDVLAIKNPLVSPSYLIYYFLYIDDAKRFKPLYKGLRKTVPFDSFMSYKIPIPPLPEQQAIASYLDTATAKIDTAIAQQQKMIDLLNERKQIIINRAVTKGLNPNVKMKDSGVEWIGEVPEHWEVKPIKRCCEFVRTKANRPHSYRVALENIQSWTGQYIQTDSVFDGLGILFKKGDVLFGKLRPYLAKVFLADQDGEALGDFWVFRPKTEILSEYLQIILLSYRVVNLIDSTTYGTKMPRADWGLNSHLMIPIPPIDSQNEIIKSIHTDCAQIDASINNFKKTIDLLRERKQIIINDVVTGKVKII